MYYYFTISLFYKVIYTSLFIYVFNYTNNNNNVRIVSNNNYIILGFGEMSINIVRSYINRVHIPLIFILKFEFVRTCQPLKTQATPLGSTLIVLKVATAKYYK